MHINFVKPNRAFPNGYLEINDARIIWKNFSGKKDRFNPEGNRNFNLVIPTQEDCDMLLADKNQFGDSWNVKIKQPREEGDVPFMHMAVKVKFNGRGPNVYLSRPGKPDLALTEDTIGCLDEMDIMSVDLDIRPYDDTLPTGGSFRTAYLSAMRVYQRVDRFAASDSYYDDDIIE